MAIIVHTHTERDAERRQSQTLVLSYRLIVRFQDMVHHSHR